MTVWSRDREVGNWPLGIAIVLWIHDHLGRAACRASVSFVVTFYWLGAKRARGCSAEYLRTVRAYMAERERDSPWTSRLMPFERKPRESLSEQYLSML